MGEWKPMVQRLRGYAQAEDIAAGEREDLLASADEIARLRAEVEDLRRNRCSDMHEELLAEQRQRLKAESELAALGRRYADSESRLAECDAALQTVQAELAALRMQYDDMKGVVHDEIAANLAFREAGGALPDEDMPTFCARLISELAALRKRVDEAEVVEIQKMPGSAFGVFCLSPQWVGKRVRLVVDD